MKAFVLKQIAQNIKMYKYVKRALRVDENLILMQFDKERYYFDLTKGSGDIYINIDYPVSKKFHAPFDVVLEKKFTKAVILDVNANERILTLTIKNQNRFKEEILKIRFEFTGRYTNAIIINEEGVVVESLRHISSFQSSRVVKPGMKLEELPPFEIKEKVFDIENVEKYTQELFKKKYQSRLKQKKESLTGKINKKIKEIKTRLSKLPDEKKLIEKSEIYKKYADVIMANLNHIKPYMKTLKTFDFEGNEIEIPLPELKNTNEAGNYYYNLSKKAKRKAKNIHIEKSHLVSQLEFLENYKKLIEKTEDIGSLNFYKPSKKEKSADENIAEFFIDGYKIMVGKNEKGNIRLLKTANSNDLWFHIKNYPGAHVIVKNNKLSVPEHVIKEAAKLAVAFSKKNEGYVDYTKRKFVKVKDGANVEYGKYSTVKVKI